MATDKSLSSTAGFESFFFETAAFFFLFFFLLGASSAATVAPPRTSVPRNHPFCRDNELDEDAIRVVDGDDWKKEAASDVDNNARKAAAEDVNLMATDRFDSDYCCIVVDL